MSKYIDTVIRCMLQTNMLFVFIRFIHVFDFKSRGSMYPKSKDPMSHRSFLVLGKSAQRILCPGIDKHVMFFKKSQFYFMHSMQLYTITRLGYTNWVYTGVQIENGFYCFLFYFSTSICVWWF